ncbi:MULTISPECIES: hypothetical protein [Roseobacteraceae]|uniref:hypothetical protein n=1 Tax=Roseobacteraceae TaxID=2854170 RepID=UPI00125FF1BD|nr:MULTISPECIES: hypothetical protein [Roseobacteraceae]|tara:strand:- start:1157 stop:1654 length:498 start_codon:yes stop_codon:yes gene_type:complete
MFRIFRKTLGADHLKCIYWDLSRYFEAYREAGTPVNVETAFPRSIVEEMYELSGHVETTVHMLRVLWQSEKSKDFVRSFSVNAFVDEAEKMDSRLLARVEAEAFVDVAKAFIDEIEVLTVRGQIKKTAKVSAFLLVVLQEIFTRWEMVLFTVNMEIIKRDEIDAI